jgi:hypothetical protein
MNLELARLRIDGGTQSRAAIDGATVDDYTEALANGATLPPVTVFFDGVVHWLADGFHRYHAYSKNGATAIDADVQNGTQSDARLFAYGANQSHGLRRTNADKRKVVVGMLTDFADWSDNRIAKHVGVNHVTVGTVRRELESTCEIHKSECRQGSDGKARKQPAQKKPAPPPATEAEAKPDSTPERAKAKAAKPKSTAPKPLPGEGVNFCDQISQTLRLHDAEQDHAFSAVIAIGILSHLNEENLCLADLLPIFSGPEKEVLKTIRGALARLTSWKMQLEQCVNREYRQRRISRQNKADVTVDAP